MGWEKCAKHGIARFPFVGQRKNAISLKPGDRVLIIGKANGWLKGKKIEDNVVGVFPEANVDIIGDVEPAEQSAEQQQRAAEQAQVSVAEFRVESSRAAQYHQAFLAAPMPVEFQMMPPPQAEPPAPNPHHSLRGVRTSTLMKIADIISDPDADENALLLALQEAGEDAEAVLSDILRELGSER